MSEFHAGKRLQKVMQKKGYQKNQKGFGEFLGVSQGWVSKTCGMERFTSARSSQLEILEKIDINVNYFALFDAQMLLSETDTYISSVEIEKLKAENKTLREENKRYKEAERERTKKDNYLETILLQQIELQGELKETQKILNDKLKNMNIV
jgi:hypothetical protein